MIETKIGKEGLDLSYQGKFPKETECVHCKGKAKIAFTMIERFQENDKYISGLYKNKRNKLWLHDCCAVAVYFCEDCLEPTALANQA